MSLFAAQVADRLAQCRRDHRPVHSLHEAYAVIREKMDSFWHEVKRPVGDRSQEAALQDLIEIGAMAQRIAEDVLHVGPEDSPFVSLNHIDERS